MKLVLIVIGIVIVVLINFVLYCCLRVASKTDRLYEKMPMHKNVADDEKMTNGEQIEK